jgi:hypothetical protein
MKWRYWCDSVDITVDMLAVFSPERDGVEVELLEKPVGLKKLCMFNCVFF